MRPESANERHRRAVETLAAQYEKQGYSAIVAPPPEATPELLRPYDPDLIVTKGGERWVIEVKTPGHAMGRLLERPGEEGRRGRLAVPDCRHGRRRG